jgi:hypothetical protein
LNTIICKLRSMLGDLLCWDAAACVTNTCCCFLCCSLQQDLADAKAHAAANGHEGDLLWWDVAFWAERLREDKYDLKDEELRPYFALPAVLDGLFKVGEG